MHGLPLQSAQRENVERAFENSQGCHSSNAEV
jgi:hypothetical protein